MVNYIDIRDIAYHLLHPNETLDVRLFNYGGQMHQDVRQQLLSNANFVINKTIGGIKYLKVKDIVLCGSSASYFYREKSDIDISIEVYNDNCPYLPDKDTYLGKLLKILQFGSTHRFNFTLNNRFVDISIRDSDNDFMGVYSLLNDKWVIEPDQHIADDLNINDILNEYTKQYDKIEKYIKELQCSGRLKTKDGIEELTKFYSAKFNYKWDIREYIVYKLLGYKGVYSRIKQLISDSRHEFTSLI
ncbi:MAG: hypothetical protein E7020_06110 [Alphaproteobacteria bacterium]|nr:hypothetical protein [Alphaproteobacteria bacterium]